MVVAVATRLAAGIVPAAASMLYAASGTAWLGAFGLFAVLYGPLLLARRPPA